MSRVVKRRAPSPRPVEPRRPSRSVDEILLTHAKAAGVQYADLLEDWQHRAAVREYDANTTREQAERLALADMGIQC